MGQKRIYPDVNEKQKAYRERKKKSGYRGVLVLVPEHLFPFIKGAPSRLVDSFVTLHKNLYIDFDSLDFATEKGVACAILRNKGGLEWKVTDPDQIRTLERLKGKARLYVDGKLEVIR
ncbi:MAG: hypothetical protein HW415_1739 [Deltaproteobacteria bacterium]|nr:hypothetical protein [Deltaproteobacteria bacterium]